MPAKVTIIPANERELADALRNAAQLSSERRYPIVGDIVEVTVSDLSTGESGIGICTGYHKGWCEVRTFGDDGELTKWLDFLSDEERHGPSKAQWKIRDDLRADNAAPKL